MEYSYLGLRSHGQASKGKNNECETHGVERTIAEMVCSNEKYEYEENSALRILLEMGEYSGSYMYYASTPGLFPSGTRIDGYM